MGFLDRFHTRFHKKSQATLLSTKRDESVIKKSAAPSNAISAPSEERLTGSSISPGHELSFRLLRKPHVSEKAAHLADLGTYVFQVSIHAEKIAIRKAVEALYRVNVVGVRTTRYQGKPMHRGRRAGVRVAWKKAFVTLAKGQTIQLYEGV
ncbi:MAG: 50S ribosomal protein L23 [Candidatus Uhrbacteria bacterium]|nr:50S ribosomal protein L23 [Candidatus Uhrbacteria bacterium]